MSATERPSHSWLLSRSKSGNMDSAHVPCMLALFQGFCFLEQDMHVTMLSSYMLSSSNLLYSTYCKDLWEQSAKQIKVSPKNTDNPQGTEISPRLPSTSGSDPDNSGPLQGSNTVLRAKYSKSSSYDQLHLVGANEHTKDGIQQSQQGQHATKTKRCESVLQISVIDALSYFNRSPCQDCQGPKGPDTDFYKQRHCLCGRQEEKPE